ncbi:hypothetical protein O181_018789 [Austropuccinia psidii MF-1]|uniref:Uncharacterized protein n=1 Tax=Austropuccinia psidii MF-1 TaxID=1389203 RepID=A0A9Q3C8C3_9BASI|nr:hypothetical protein [Austropuccinia psidii MF-1]
MEATIQSNKMDGDREEERTGPDLTSLPQERHVWRMPELTPISQVPVKKLVQLSQGRDVGNITKPLEGGMNSYLHIKRFLGQERTIEILGAWSSLSFKAKVKKIKKWLKNQSILSIDKRKELKMTPALEKEGPVASNNSKPNPEVSEDKPNGPYKKHRAPKNNKGIANLQTLPTRVKDPQVGAFSCGQCIQYFQNPY